MAEHRDASNNRKHSRSILTFLVVKVQSRKLSPSVRLGYPLRWLQQRADKVV
jgi:hypothetical protein